MLVLIFANRNINTSTAVLIFSAKELSYEKKQNDGLIESSLSKVISLICRDINDGAKVRNYSQLSKHTAEKSTKYPQYNIQNAKAQNPEYHDYMIMMVEKWRGGGKIIRFNTLEGGLMGGGDRIEG